MLPEVHPEYPDMAVRIGVILTVKGRQYATQLRSGQTHLAFAPACQRGHTGFLPLTTDRLDWGYDWAAFMAG